MSRSKSSDSAATATRVPSGERAGSLMPGSAAPIVRRLPLAVDGDGLDGVESIRISRNARIPSSETEKRPYGANRKGAPVVSSFPTEKGKAHPPRALFPEERETRRWPDGERTGSWNRSPGLSRTNLLRPSSNSPIRPLDDSAKRIAFRPGTARGPVRISFSPAARRSVGTPPSSGIEKRPASAMPSRRSLPFPCETPHRKPVSGSEPIGRGSPASVPTCQSSPFFRFSRRTTSRPSRVQHCNVPCHGSWIRFGWSRSSRRTQIVPCAPHATWRPSEERSATLRVPSAPGVSIVKRTKGVVEAAGAEGPRYVAPPSAPITPSATPAARTNATRGRFGGAAAGPSACSAGPLRTASRASRASPISRRRPFGLRSRQRDSRRRTSRGVASGRAEKSISARRTPASVSAMESPAKRRFPDSISKRTTPKAQMSARRSTARPFACSGAM